MKNLVGELSHPLTVACLSCHRAGTTPYLPARIRNVRDEDAGLNRKVVIQR
jgi:hypothetical protein